MASQNNDNRWWEFYFVRYSMGTIVGAVIAYYLLKDIDGLGGLLLPQKTEDFEYFHYLNFLVLGLTYCYIASAPILLMHAARNRIKYSGKYSWIFPIWFLSLLIIMISIIVVSALTNSVCAKIVLAILLSVLILAPQIILVVDSLANLDDKYEFYKKLWKVRDKVSSDSLDSYKHLREHGNSFSILLCEIILGFILFLMNGNIYWMIGFLIIWIFPASTAWHIGTALERKLSDDSELSK